MSTFDILCVTNRKLCPYDFLTHLEKIAQSGVNGIILREKDITENEYFNLASKVIDICKDCGVRCILHTFTNVSIQLNAEAIHLPMYQLRMMSEHEKRHFKIIGASCHSVSEAIEAKMLGCTYVTAGHIFQTDCKKGLPGRGLEFLGKVCQNVSIPVYAIGGIDTINVKEVFKAGAKGACFMSSFMMEDDVKEFLKSMEVEK